MLARIVNVSHAIDNCFSFVFTVEDYNDHNVVYETANYYNSNGDACLTATDANMHPRRNHMKEDVYFTNDDRVEEWFEIVSDDASELYKRYADTAADGSSYVEWLEKKVVELENEVAALVEI